MATNNPIRARRLVVNIEIENISEKALLDTGLSSNFPRGDLFDRITHAPETDLPPSRFVSLMIRI